jgi:phosphoribosylamine-glycine ligase
VIKGIPAETDDSVTFHAGSVLENDQLKTAGGRVLCVVGLGGTVRVLTKLLMKQWIKFILMVCSFVATLAGVQ